MSKPMYSKVVLKLSGEVMLGGLDYGVDIEYMKKLSEQLVQIVSSGTSLLIEVGGGNIYRWRQAAVGMQRNTGDMMGMLGSVMNALNLRDVLSERTSAEALSQIHMPYVIPFYTPKKAKELFDNGTIVVVGGGSGQQYFTTDSGAALHASHVDADIVLKGSGVDGVYSADPKKDENAERFEKLSYDEVLEKQLGVMDMTAFALLREAEIPTFVFDVREEDAILNAVNGTQKGTLIS